MNEIIKAMEEAAFRYRRFRRMRRDRPLCAWISESSQTQGQQSLLGGITDPVSFRCSRPQAIFLKNLQCDSLDKRGKADGYRLPFIFISKRQIYNHIP